MQILQRKYSLGVFMVLYFAFCNSVNAQDNVADIGYGNYNNAFQVWTSVKVSHDFKYGISASAQYLLRTDITNRNIGGHYFYVGAKYKALKYLQIDFKFRGVNTVEKNLYRFEFGIKSRYKYKDWTFAFRAAYFNEREYFSRVYEKGRYPTNYWRNRVEVRWDFKKDWGTYLSVEAYALFDYRGASLRRVAFVAGVDYKFLKMHSIDVYYMAQPDFNKKSPNLVQAVAVVYTWDIPKKFKKKKKD